MNKCDSSDVTDEDVNNFKLEDLTPNEQLKWNTELTIDNFIFQTVMTIFTIYALFGDDLRLWVIPA